MLTPHSGTPYAVGAYLLWGSFAAFFGLLAFAGPVEILAQRIVWTLVVMLVLVVATGRRRGMLAIPARVWLLCAAASAAVATNWGVYVYGVTSGHIVECALGYFVNPLVSVLFGVAFFGERLNRWQIAAVGVAALAVVVLTVDYGRPPWIALVLAFSFATYGVIKKVVPLDPIRSLTAEGIVAAPVALAYLLWLARTSASTFGEWPAHTLLLIASGPVTTVPLLLFGAAAQRVPLVTLGLLQYLTPGLQMAWGVAVVHEAMPASRWIGFVLIWSALVVFSIDAVRRARADVRPAEPVPTP